MTNVQDTDSFARPELGANLIVRVKKEGKWWWCGITQTRKFVPDVVGAGFAARMGQRSYHLRAPVGERPEFGIKLIKCAIVSPDAGGVQFFKKKIVRSHTHRL